jgi:ornithine cyclodeaminase
VGEDFRIIGMESLRPLLDRRRVIAVVRDALVWQAAGRVQSPPPGQLLFTQPRGDCHIKYGHVTGSSTFAIKVATGFYGNPGRGLPVNHGLTLIFDAHTGSPRVLLKDDGWLTAWRTAAATAIAAATLAPPQVTAIGVLGTGLQASLALDWLPDTLGPLPLMVWGRNRRKADELAAAAGGGAHRVVAVDRIDEIFERCNIVITTTPASAPLFPADIVKPGTHIVGVGADSPNKQELPGELFKRASHVLTDDHAQCLDHGDYGAAVREGAIAPTAAVMMGDVLAGKITLPRSPEDITIVDLTGVAVEDIAIADLFLKLLAESSCEGQS